jgi:hypothetical protein
MSWLPLSFGAPLVLLGLVALPVIWWLLRLTPPRPQTETFPPLRILAQVLRREETPHQSPWWLTLLRLLMAGLIVLALAEPVMNPRERTAVDAGAIAIVVDNGWASANDWDLRRATAERLIDDAEASSVPIMLAFTAERPDGEIGPFDAATARERLAAAEPRPVPTNRRVTFGRVAEVMTQTPGMALAVLADGLAGTDDEAAFENLLSSASRLIWAEPQRLDMIAVTAASNEPDAFLVEAVRPAGEPLPRSVTAAALDDRGRRIADAVISFDAGATRATGAFAVPFELRNDFAAIVLDGQNNAGATFVLDETSQRRRIGLISQAEGDLAQPLLSPLHYITRALSPYADLIEADSADLAEAIPQILAQNPAIIVLADVGTLPQTAREPLVEWLNEGGTLLRFAGSRLAAAEHDDELLPVRLRSGERALGGTLSWTEPQPVADFPAASPFAGLPAPQEVTVSRQVLAEPTSDIIDRSWAVLQDGTPLVTADTRGNGNLVLFHITPQATWSNLPISGTFVEMLRRIVQLSRNQGAASAATNGSEASLPPYRLIAADGQLVPPTPQARPLPLGASQIAVDIDHPPGLYGSEDGVVAHNLLGQDAELFPLRVPAANLPVSRIAYAINEAVDLRGALIAAALLLLALDTLAVLWLGGRLRRRVPASSGRVGAASASLLAIALLVTVPPEARAQDDATDDLAAIEAISQTRIAYVVTGNDAIDEISRSGLYGLSRFLIDKTALEPGEPAAVDLESDELAFYPLIYWPVDETTPMPSEQAIARVDAYMQQGGTVLFDTRDQYSSGFGAGAASPSTMRLREILADMNVPPLEPVPEDHVLTKTFYIMPDFPGRYSGGPLWVEASLEADRNVDRPVRTGDGVTPIMITSNDLAGAWAIDEAGNSLLPTIPADPMQRVYAFRAGVNIMMYMLTGNYKSDQVHVPALLERLGQ